MTKTMRAAFLSSARDSRVERYHSMTRVRTDSDMASPSFNGSSMMIRLLPSPVRVPSMEVAIRLPRLVVVDLAVGIALQAHRREAGLIDRMVDNQAEVIGIG